MKLQKAMMRYFVAKIKENVHTFLLLISLFFFFFLFKTKIKRIVLFFEMDNVQIRKKYKNRKL